LIQKHLQPEAKFDPLTEFTFVSNAISSPTVLVVRADSPHRSIQDLIADAKKKRPGKLNYGSGGIGTSPHLACASFEAVAGLKAVHVPLRGSVEIAPSLLRGDTDFAFSVSGTAIPQVKAGKVRALAVSSAHRLRDFPDVPTLAEALKNDLLIQESWFGFWAPTRTPPAVLQTLQAATVKALGNAELRAQLEEQGGFAAPSKSPRIRRVREERAHQVGRDREALGGKGGLEENRRATLRRVAIIPNLGSYEGRSPSFHWN
jgi:tripartite-type tricarboxylate transporter receptor subunit TctC